MKILSAEEKRTLEAIEAREIAFELTKECSQFKLKKLIEVLALCLEDRELLLSIVKLIKQANGEEEATATKPTQLKKSTLQIK